MSTSSKTIQFASALGNGAEMTLGIATIYSIGQSAPIVLATSTVKSPDFEFMIPVTDGNYYYIVLQVSNYQLNSVSYTTGDRDLSLLSVFDDSAVSVTVGPQSTIANAYAFARMIYSTANIEIAIKGTNRMLGLAYGMKNNFISTGGNISPVISSSPNGLESNSYALFNFLSNLLYYNVTDASVYNGFLSLASADTSSSFFQALMHLVHQPFTNVEQIYQLISAMEQVFQPSLPQLTLPRHKSPVPDQWTLTIKANDSGAQNFLIGGPAYVVFDKEDKAWIANNVRQGTAYSGTYCIVLNPDGSPAAISPVFGGGLLGAGFGAAIDPARETIAIGNYGWGPEQFNPQTGSVSIFSYDGTVLSPPNGFTSQVTRAQGMCYDSAGNLWIASIGSEKPMAPSPGGLYTFENQNSAIVVYPGGDPAQAIHYNNFGNNPSPYHATFGVVMDSQGNAFVSNIGDASEGVPSSLYKFRLDNGELVCLASWISDYQNPRTGEIGYEEFRQVQVNAQDEVFVVGITSSRVIKLDNDLENVLQVFEKNINAPWGINIDGQGTMYVANFGQEKGRDPENNSLDMQGPFGVTVIRNEDENTAKLMTLPTGGAPVTLRNGFPLYGSQTIKGKQIVSYEPIMRLTSTNIDGAGNLWAMNNWKPSAYVDVKDNPGGDGVVIFVGVAEPS